MAEHDKEEKAESEVEAKAKSAPELESEPVRSVPPPIEYEFGQKQNELVGALAGRMSFVGTMMIVFGVLLDVLGLISIFVLHIQETGAGALWNIIAGASLLAVGFWTRGAAERFQRIVDTEGKDVSNLMIALEELFRIYSLQRILFIFTSALAVGGTLLYLLTKP